MSLLQMDVDSHLQPVLQYLQQQQGMPLQAAATFLRSNPSLLYGSSYQAQAQQLLRSEKLRQLALV